MLLRGLLFFLLCTGLNAAMTITFDQIGNDVVSYYSGALDTDHADIFDYGTLGSAVTKFNPSLGYYVKTPSSWRTPTGPYVVDNPSSNSPFYDGPRLGTGSGFGTGTAFEPTQISGDIFGIFQNSLVLPDDWTSGSNISGQMTWANTSIASLGVDTSQVHTWKLRGTGDTITMSVVPESSSYAMILGGLVLGLMAYRRQRFSIIVLS